MIVLAHLGTLMARVHASSLRTTLLISVLATCLWFVAAPFARACGETPASVTLLARDGEVFAGARALDLYVYGFSFELADAYVTLHDVSDEQPLSVTATLRATNVDWLYRVELADDALRAGHGYTLEFVSEPTRGAPGHTQQIDFVAVAAPREPTQLGTLVRTSQDAGVVSVGGCGEQRAGVQALLDLEADAAASPWARAAQHVLLVDGEVMPAPSLPLVDYVAREQALRVRAYAICSQQPIDGRDDGLPLDAAAIDVELAPGLHNVAWKAVFPSGRALTTEAVELDLDCDELPPSIPNDDRAVSDNCAVAGARGSLWSWLLVSVLLWLRARPRTKAALVNRA